MQLRIITILFSSRLDGFDDDLLRSFLSDKQMHGVESWHFVHEGTPCWSFCVTYTLIVAAVAAAATHAPGKKEKEAWRKRLGEQEWPVFNALRQWRKERADQERIPAYLVFTNAQLTRILLDKVALLSAQLL